MRHTRTAGTNWLLAVHVLQRRTRDGTGHNLARNALRWLLVQVRRHATLALLLLNR